MIYDDSIYNDMAKMMVGATPDEGLTGEELHKMFTSIKARIPTGGANYFRDRKVFTKMAEELNKRGD